jgi:hypothetical protein
MCTEVVLHCWSCALCVPDNHKLQQQRAPTKPAPADPLSALPLLPLLQLTGKLSQLAGVFHDVVDFYTKFAEQRGKPMVVAETGAWYNLCEPFPNKTNCTRQTEVRGQSASRRGTVTSACTCACEGGASCQKWGTRTSACSCACA